MNVTTLRHEDGSAGGGKTDLISSTVGLINTTTTTTTTPVSEAAFLVQPKEEEEIPVAAIIGAVVVIVGFIIIVLFGSRRIRQKPSRAPSDRTETDESARNTESSTVNSNRQESASVSISDYEDTLERTGTWTEEVNRATYMYADGIRSSAYSSTDPNYSGTYTYPDEPGQRDSSPRVQDTVQAIADVHNESPNSDKTTSIVNAPSTTSSGNTKEETASTVSHNGPYTSLQHENRQGISPDDLERCTCKHLHPFPVPEGDSRPVSETSSSQHSNLRFQQGSAHDANSEELDETISEGGSVVSSSRAPRNSRLELLIPPTTERSISTDSRTPGTPLSPTTPVHPLPKTPERLPPIPPDHLPLRFTGQRPRRNSEQLPYMIPEHLPLSSQAQYPPEFRGNLPFRPTEQHSRRDSEPHPLASLGQPPNNFHVNQNQPRYCRRLSEQPLPTFLKDPQLLVSTSPDREMPARSCRRQASLGYVPQSQEAPDLSLKRQTLSFQQPQTDQKQKFYPPSSASSQSEPPIGLKEEQMSPGEQSTTQQDSFIPNVQPKTKQNQVCEISTPSNSDQFDSEGNNSTATGQLGEESTLVYPPGSGYSDTDTLPTSSSTGRGLSEQNQQLRAKTSSNHEMPTQHSAESEVTNALDLSPTIENSSPVQIQKSSPRFHLENGNFDTDDLPPSPEPVAESGMKCTGNIKNSPVTEDDPVVFIAPKRPDFPPLDPDMYIIPYYKKMHEPAFPRVQREQVNEESDLAHSPGLTNGNFDTHTLPPSSFSGRRHSEHLPPAFQQDQALPMRTSYNHEIPSQSSTRQTSVPNASLLQQEETMVPDLSPKLQTSSLQDQQFIPRSHPENGDTDAGIPFPSQVPVADQHLASHALQNPPVSSLSKEIGRHPSDTDESGMKSTENVKNSPGTDGPPGGSSPFIPPERPDFPRRDTGTYITLQKSHSMEV